MLGLCLQQSLLPPTHTLYLPSLFPHIHTHTVVDAKDNTGHGRQKDFADLATQVHKTSYLYSETSPMRPNVLWIRHRKNTLVEGGDGS